MKALICRFSVWLFFVNRTFAIRLSKNQGEKVGPVDECEPCISLCDKIYQGVLKLILHAHNTYVAICHFKCKLMSLEDRTGSATLGGTW